MDAPPARGRAAPAALAVIAAVLALQLAAAPRLSPTYDEPSHLRYGRQILLGDAHRFDDSKMPVSAFNAAPGAIAASLAPGRLHDALAGWTAARAGTMLATAVLLALVWHWSRRLWGERGALLSLGCCALDPNLIAHGGLVTTDAWAALAWLLVLFTAWRAAQAPSVRHTMELGAALGAALAVKDSAVLLVPIVALLTAAAWIPRWRAAAQSSSDVPTRAVRRALIGVACATAVTLFVLNGAFLCQGTGARLADYSFITDSLQHLQARAGVAARVPLPVPVPWLQGIDWVRYRERTGEGFGRIYLRGELRQGRGFRSYYAWAWLYKVPLAIQGILVAAALAAWRWRRELRWRADVAFLLVPPLLYAIYLSLFLRAQLGMRLSLPCFPPLYVFAGVLLSRPARVTRSGALALGGALAWALVSVLSWRPFYLSYMNELVRNRSEAWRVLADSNLDWGQSEYALHDWLSRHPGAVVAPPRPQAGVIVVPANSLVGIGGDPETYRWLRALRPAGSIGYSYVVFEVPASANQSPAHTLGSTSSPSAARAASQPAT